jgi:uncharacterized surface protein with fasciclin (FAS1) repeats
MKTQQLKHAALLASLMAAAPIAYAKDTPTGEDLQKSALEKTSTPEKQKPQIQPEAAAGDTTTPPAQASSLCEIVQADSALEILQKALKAADLETTLDDDQASFTLFAPSDDAFDKLPAGTLEKLLRPENKKDLRKLLLHHVIGEKLTAAALKSGNVKTISGETIQVSSTAGAVEISGAKVSSADRMASNGVVHTINAVLVPESLKLEELK